MFRVVTNHKDGATGAISEFLTDGKSDWIRSWGHLGDDFLAAKIKGGWQGDLEYMTDLDPSGWPALYNDLIMEFLAGVDWDQVVKNLRLATR